MLKTNLPDTIVYNKLTLFTFQLSSVQIPTPSDASLTDLIKYFVSLALSFLQPNETPHNPN